MCKPSIKIFVACQNQTGIPENGMIKKIQVGSAGAKRRLSAMYHDDEGENISQKNQIYCELTAQYYAWKNLKADYYGFCHYRRYLNFSKEYLPYDKRMPERIHPLPYIEVNQWCATMSKDLLDETRIQSVVEKYDVIAVLGEYMNITVYEQFCQFHNQKDLDKIIRILKRRCPDYAYACDVYMKSKYIYFCNMYIMRQEYFVEYMAWLFPLLEEFEIDENISGCAKGKARIIGYLAERLFGVYFTWLGQQGKARRCELQYIVFQPGQNIRQFQLWANGPKLAVDMKKINRLLPASSLRRRFLRTLTGRLFLWNRQK